MLDKFLNNVCDKNLISQEKCILIPKRIGRNNDIMNSVYNKLNNFFRVKYIDFAEYSISFSASDYYQSLDYKSIIPLWGMMA